jgi:hypothetical protein
MPAPLPQERRIRVLTHIVIRDNESDKSVVLAAEMPKGDLDFLNRIGERIAHDTGWKITVVAVKGSP